MVIVRVKGVHRVKVEKAGKRYVYHYHRATGTRLKSPPGTAAFAAEVAALDASLPTPEDSTKGTFGYLVDAYRRSPEYTGLRARTRVGYDDVLSYLKPLRDKPLTGFTSPLIVGIRDRAYETRKRRFANLCIQVLSVVLGWGVQRGHLPVNPARGVSQVKRPSGMAPANPPWTDAEVAAMLDALSGGMKRGFVLGAYFGLRLGDVIACEASRYRDGRITIRTSKTGAEVSIPAHPVALAALAEMPAKATHIVARSDGKPYTLDGFKANFYRTLRTLIKAGVIRKGQTFHGLRHTVGGKLAEAGADGETIAAWLGHSTTRMAGHYTRRASRARLIDSAAERMGKV